VFAVPVSFNRYQYNAQYYDPDAKPSMIEFMKPYAIGSCAPDKCLGNDIAAVKGRVLDICEKGDVVVNPRDVGFMSDFVNYLFPQAHTFEPCSLEEVKERQPRPSQQSIYNSATSSVVNSRHAPHSTFQKSEAYTKVTEPRIITEDEKHHKIHYSRFTYPLSDYFQRFKWYAFGKKPVEIAQRVADCCVRAKRTAVMTDFSRYDGRCGTVYRLLDKMVFLRAYKPVYHEELGTYADDCVNLLSFTAFRVWFETLLTQLSGVPDTAMLNTVRNAFTTYRTCRAWGLSHEMALEHLGIYGGDDGLSIDMPVKAFEDSAKEFNQKLECEEVVRGKFGVNFLSRYYGPDVWFGATDSCCDIRRQITKLHLTHPCASNVSPLRKFTEKMLGYVYSDKNTPIIGEILKCASKFIDFPEKLGLDGTRGIANYAASCCDELSDCYPNQYGTWMHDFAIGQMPHFDFKGMTMYLEVITKVEQLLDVPYFWDSALEYTAKGGIANPPPGVIVNGELPAQHPLKPIVDAAKAIIEPKKKNPLNKKPKVDKSDAIYKGCCKPFQNGMCTYGNKCKYKHELVKLPNADERKES